VRVCDIVNDRRRRRRRRSIRILLLISRAPRPFTNRSAAAAAGIDAVRRPSSEYDCPLCRRRTLRAAVRCKW